MNSWSTFFRQATLLCCLVVAALAVVLMAVKHQVQRLEEDLVALNQKIATERQAIHVLHAEFSFLAEPERLRRLAAAHLGLAPIEPGQLGTFAIIDGMKAEGHEAAAPIRLPVPRLQPVKAAEAR